MASSVVVSGLHARENALALAVARRLRQAGVVVVDADDAAGGDAAGGSAGHEGVACVLHLSGATSSSRRLDDAVAEDVDQTGLLLDRARAARAPFVFASRLSVAGGKKGLVAEVDPRTVSFGPGAVRGADVDVVKERASLVARAAFARQSVLQADLEALRRQQVRDDLVARGGPAHGRGYERAVDDAREAELSAALKIALVERASARGFPTASTWAARGFTRALGELLCAAASDAAGDAAVKVALVRLPALLTPLSDDHDGANDGDGDGDRDDDDAGFDAGHRAGNGGLALLPLLDRVHDGALRLPFLPRARAEVLPLDVVADAVVAVVLGSLADTAPALAVVHVATADQNPLPATRLLDLLDLHLSKSTDKPALARFLSVDDALALPPGLDQARDLAARTASTAVALIADRAAARLGERAEHGLKARGDELSTSIRAMARPAARDTALVQAPPFFADDVRFAQRGLRMACARAATFLNGREAIDTGDLDWRVHLLERHLPALDEKRQARSSVASKAKKPIPPFDSLAHLLIEAAARHRSKTALALFLPAAQGTDLVATGSSDVVEVSYRELFDRARAAALRLEAAGVTAGDRVVIAAQNHPDWAVTAFGVLLLRATLVPLDANIEPAAADNILKKARPALCVVDKGVRARLSSVLREPVLDLHLTAVSGPGIDVSESAGRALPASSELASILFTSGTTGDPKGVMLSHGNFCALLGSLLSVFPVTGSDRMLSVLPLHHTFEFTCGLLMPLAAGATVYTPDAVVGERVLYAMKAGRITAIVGVPALWQLLERRITKQSQDRGELASSVFQTLLKINKSLGTKFGVSAGKLLLKPVHDQFGGHLRVLISGGSALPPAVHEMFQGLGLPLAEGYGLTETSPVLTVAEGKMGLPAGTVGHAIPGVELKLVDVDSGALVVKHGAMGEIWARADNVMQGYFENDAATDAVLTKDGWLKTGDLGTIASDGTVRIVGRSKDVVVTAAGENIYLDDVEKRLEHIPSVFELSLLGIADPKGGERLACVFVASVAGANGSADVVTSDPQVQQKARQQLGQRLLKLPGWQRAAVVEVYDTALPRTASRKVKRRELKKWLESLLHQRDLALQDGGDASERDARGNVFSLSPVRLAIARTAGVEVNKVLGPTSLPADLGFDSLMWVELQQQLEALLNGIKLDPELLVTKETVAEIELLVQEAPSLPQKPTQQTSTKKRASTKHNATNGDGDDEDDGGDGDTSNMPAALREALELAVKQPGIAAGRGALSLFQETLFTQGFKTTVEGRAFVPANRNVIVVANHTSHLDTGLVKFALGQYAQQLRPLAAKDYFFEGNPLKVAFFEHLTNLVPIDRETGSGLAFEQARAVVEQGHIVLIFPEGTRREDGTLGSFKPLVAKLAMATGVDVLPLHLTGAFDAFPRGANLPKFGAHLKATIGPALPASELLRLTSHLGPVQAARAAADVIRQSVVALRDGRALELSRAPSLDALDRATRVMPRAG